LIPASLIVSTIGVFRDGRKRYAIAGAVIAALMGAFFFGLPILLVLLRT